MANTTKTESKQCKLRNKEVRVLLEAVGEIGNLNALGWVTRKCFGKELIGKKRPPFSEEHKKNISNSRKGRFIGKDNPNYGNHKLAGDNNPAKRIDVRKKISIGVKRSFENPERRLANRIARLNKVMPNFNKNACRIIDEYGNEYGYRFQHALNGGEIRVIGYSLDGYDKKKNVVIEYYENAHKKRWRRDLIRKRRIVKHLGCKFIELKEWEL
jgi:hypothetical protein